MNIETLDLSTMRRGARAAAALLKTLGNEHRLMVLCHLRDGEMSVGALERAVGLGQSALSQHLARLRGDGLVGTRRVAQTIYYRLTAEAPGRVIDVLYEIFCAPRTGDET